MRILILSGAIYAKDSKRKYFTGLDYVVTQIGQLLSEGNEVIFFTTSPIGKKSVVKDCNVYSYSNINLMPYVLKVKFRSYLNALTMDCSLKEKVKNIRSLIIAEYFEKVINIEKPNIIHINGITYGNLLCADKAKGKYPIAYTLHGLSYTSNECSDFQKNIERNFIKNAYENNLKFSVVSSGVKKIIEADFKGKFNICIIKNIIDIKDCTESKEILRKKYGIPKEAKVLICVGSIGYRKNQIQVIRAIQLLPDDYKKNMFIVFAGKNKIKDSFDKEIEKAYLMKQVLITGFVSKNELAKLYKMADANIVLSKSEGFGLSIIEAGYFGLPTIMFEDLDAYEDVYFEEGFTIIKDREDKSVANAIKYTFDTKWNTDVIKQKSKTEESIFKKQYLEFYREVISDFKFINFDEIIKEMESKNEICSNQ